MAASQAQLQLWELFIRLLTKAEDKAGMDILRSKQRGMRSLAGFRVSGTLKTNQMLRRRLIASTHLLDFVIFEMMMNRFDASKVGQACCPLFGDELKKMVDVKLTLAESQSAASAASLSQVLDEASASMDQLPEALAKAAGKKEVTPEEAFKACLFAIFSLTFPETTTYEIFLAALQRSRLFRPFLPQSMLETPLSVSKALGEAPQPAAEASAAESAPAASSAAPEAVKAEAQDECTPPAPSEEKPSSSQPARNEASSAPQEPSTRPAASQAAAPIPEAASAPAQAPAAKPASEKPHAERPSTVHAGSPDDLRGYPDRIISDGPAPRTFSLESPAVRERPAEPGPGIERWLGYVTQQSGWWNFHMTAVWRRGRFEPVAPQEAVQRFPRFGAVNLFSAQTRIKLSEGAFYAMDLEPDGDLSPNRGASGLAPREDYELRVDYERLAASERLRPMEAFGGYIVVRPAESAPLDFERNIPVRIAAGASPELPPGTLRLANVPVLLEADGRLYGPMPLKEDASRRPYVNVQSGSNRGIVRAFSPDGARGRHRFFEYCGAGVNAPIDAVFTDDLPIELCDVLSDEALLKKLGAAVSTDKAAREKVAGWVQSNLESSDLFTDDLRIRRARSQRIETILESESQNERFYDDVARLLSETLDRSASESSPLFSAVVKRVMQDPALQQNLQQHKLIRRELDALEAERAAKQREVESLAKTAADRSRAKKKELEAANRALLSERDQLEKAVEEKKSELEALTETAELAALREKLSADAARLQHENEELEAEGKRIIERLDKAVSDPSRFAFNGALAAKLTEAAARWTEGEESAGYEERAKSLSALKLSPLAGRALADYLVEAVQARRSYSRNEILALFLTLSQSFLTVFSGPPGSGKTTICRILADALGLRSLSARLAGQAAWPDPEAANRFLAVPVERGWTSKRDFIGYWNPLTHTFESIDPRRCDAFRELDAEKRAGFAALPYLMLLDEANLSPMEYYFADFMPICDERSRTSAIALGDRTRCGIPDTLRFAATINNDHTTEILSPRLIDRAAVVTLPEADWSSLSAEAAGSGEPDPDAPLISWANLTALFAPGDPSAGRSQMRGILEDLYEAFAKLGFPASARTRIACSRFASAAARVFSSERQPAHIEAADFACAQKLLPRIAGNGDLFREGLVELKTLLEGNGLERSLALLEDIIERGDRSMGYYRFF